MGILPNQSIPPFCKPLDCSIDLKLPVLYAPVYFSTDIPHYRQVCLSGSPRLDILFVTIDIGFVFNSPPSTFGPCNPPTSIQYWIHNVTVTYSHHQSLQTDHLHHWQSSAVMPEQKQPSVVLQFLPYCS